MTHKKKILRIITSLDPKFGGPARGIIESTIQLNKLGFQTKIIKLNKNKLKFNKDKKN